MKMGVRDVRLETQLANLRRVWRSVFPLASPLRHSPDVPVRIPPTAQFQHRRTLFGFVFEALQDGPRLLAGFTAARCCPDDQRGSVRVTAQ